MNYPNLFSPIKIGSLTIRNRIDMAPMGVSDLTPEGYLTPANIAFYGERAKGGAGIVTIGESLVDSSTGKAHGRMVPLDSEEILPYLIDCTDEIKRHGAVASIELIHAGRRANPQYTNGFVYGPSAGDCIYGGKVIEMDETMIEYMVEKFGDAAEIAKLGGVDMCMVHGGHGWLLGQFLSPVNNQRTDRFGGNLENRARISMMVIDNIRKKCGKDFPIEYRISGDEFMPGGFDLEEAIELAKMLDGKVDLIHVSATSFHDKDAAQRMFPNTFLPRGCNVYLAEAVKKAVKNTPVTTVGALNDPEELEKIISSGTADMVAMARGLVADPNFPVKARSGQADDITPCIRCNYCLSGNFVPYIKYPTRVLRCTVNPLCGKELENRLPKKAAVCKKVVIVGGGPAGMQAATTACDRGHEVTLIEKSNVLGGAVNYAVRPEFKKDIEKLIQVLERRVRNRPIEVLMNTEAAPALIKSMNPDALIIAVGAAPAVPPIPGMNKPHVHLAAHLEQNVQIEGPVVVIGGGLVGCEEGLHLAKEQGMDVTVLEMKDSAATDAPFLHWRALMIELEKEEKFHLKTQIKCSEIADDGVHGVDAAGNHVVFPAKTVLVAAGMKPLSELTDSLRSCVNEYYVVGDCKKPAKIMEALHYGYFASMDL